MLVGRRSIAAFSALTVDEALAAIDDITVAKRLAPVAEPLFKEIAQRLRFLQQVGLGYLTLDRPAASLAGGESQRIRLATQIGTRLRGVMYVLDEPSIGLHHRDNQRLLEALREIRDQGNSVIVVEHDEDTIRAERLSRRRRPRCGSRMAARSSRCRAHRPTSIASNPDSLTA